MKERAYWCHRRFKRDWPWAQWWAWWQRHTRERWRTLNRPAAEVRHGRGGNDG
jgi:hypothetical protein